MKAGLPILAAVLLALLAGGCEDRAAVPERPIAVQTIETTPARLSAIDPPPTLQDRSLPARPSIPPAAAPPVDPSAQPTAEDELNAKTNLPFTPLIAMDPVDGSKVPITAETPVFSYKDRWYYFSSPANKAAFRANPETYVKGSLSTY